MPGEAWTAGGPVRVLGASPGSIVRIAGILAGGFLSYVAFRGIDLSHVARLIRGLGLSAAVVILPSFAALSLEVFAWRSAFSILGPRPTFWALVRVRVASESAGSILPFGAVWAEGLKLHLLPKHCGTPTSTNVVGVASRRYLLLLAQSVYLLAGFVLGHHALGVGFDWLAGSSNWAVLVPGAALGLLLSSEAMALSLRGSLAFHAALRALARLPCRALREKLASWDAELARSDETATRFFGASLNLRLRLATPCLLAWLSEATETWLLLHLLGSNIAWGDAVGVEALVVLGRNLLVVVPGGLGVQEIGYAVFLAGMGCDPTCCCAFMVLKRLRELFWVATGGALLAGHSRHAAPPSSTSSALARDASLRPRGPGLATKRKQCRTSAGRRARRITALERALAPANTNDGHSRVTIT